MPVTAPTRSSERPTRRQPFLTAETTSDATLVALAARGDERAFELLFQRHRTDVLAYATRMLRDHGRAEDVVQDVFVSAMRAIVGADRATQPVHVRAWLREIARRACIDQWRGATRRGEVSLDAPDRLRAADAHRLADDDSLARTTDGREAVATLRLAFSDLPQLQHAVLVQRELEGRSIAEIADRLETTPTVVEGQLSRGRRALGQAYKELESGERCVAVRALCDVSIEGRLGVRDRHRVGHHVQGCDGCRRYARVAGVDARLIDRGVLQRASLLLPLPILRRLPMDHVIAGEAAGGALGAKIIVGAAVIAAGGGGVYARSVVVPTSPSKPAATPETQIVDDGIARFGMRTGVTGSPVLRLPGPVGSGASGAFPSLGRSGERGTALAPWLTGSTPTAPAPAITGGQDEAATDAAETPETGADAVVAPAEAGSSSTAPALGATPARSAAPARSVPLTPSSPTHASSDDGPASPTDDTPESGAGTSPSSPGDTPSDDAPMTAAAPIQSTAPAEAAAPATPAPATPAPAEPAPAVPSTPAADAPAPVVTTPATPDGTGSVPAASGEGAGVG